MDYDSELQLHNEVFREAWSIEPRDSVLDVGCGAGATTRDAARMAAAGSALGVDISAQMIDRARELAQAEGLRNVAFERADAQVHRFPQERFDVAISRFGTMFFDDPLAAFANIARALRPAGRLVMMVWQEHACNEWSVSINRSLGGGDGAPAPAGSVGDPFSLAEPAAVEEILGAAGFGQVTFTDVRVPMFFGPDVAAALDWIGGFTSTQEALERLDPVAAEQARQRLTETLDAHADERGVWFDSRAWVVEARQLPQAGISTFE